VVAALGSRASDRDVNELQWRRRPNLEVEKNMSTVLRFVASSLAILSVFGCTVTTSPAQGARPAATVTVSPPRPPTTTPPAAARPAATPPTTTARPTPVLPSRVALDVRLETVLPFRETYSDTRGGNAAFVPGTNLLVGQIGTHRKTQTAIWDLDTTQRIYDIAQDVEDPRGGVAVDPSGRYIAINDHLRSIIQIDLSNGTEQRLDIRANSIQYLPGGTLVYLRNGSIFTHTPGSNIDNQIGTHDRYDNIATNGQHLVASHRTNHRANVEVFNPTQQTRQEYRPTEQGENWIRALAIGPDGQHVASTNRTGAYVHVVSSGTQVNTVTWDYPDSIALHPEHPIIALTATSGSQQGLLIYDYRAGEVILEHRQRHLRGVAFNDDGTYLAVGSNEGMRIYSISPPHDATTPPAPATPTATPTPTPAATPTATPAATPPTTTARPSAFFESFDGPGFGATGEWTLTIAGNKSTDPRLNYVDTTAGFARFVSSRHDGRGGSVGLERQVGIPVHDGTLVGFDARAVFRDVRGGCGDHCTEHPVVVVLFLADDTGQEFRAHYAVNYGGAVRDREDEGRAWVATDVPRDTWVRDLSFRIRNAWPAATRVTRISLHGSGWNFDGAVDNLWIGSGTE
jgi:hypothetical protein